MSTPYILLIGDTFPLTPTFDHTPVVFQQADGHPGTGHTLHEGWLVPLSPKQGAAVQKEADELSGYIHVTNKGRATRVFGSHYGDDNLDLGKVEAAYADHVYRFCILDDAGRKVSEWYGFSNNPETL